MIVKNFLNHLYSEVFSVRKQEVSKIFVLALMLVLIIYVYSIQRGIRDSLVVIHLGAEFIIAIKILGVVPFAFLFLLLYFKLKNYFKTTRIFHLSNFFFLSFFVFFTFILYPKCQDSHLKLIGDLNGFPIIHFLKVMTENWSLTLLFIFSELWANVMLNFLFWQIVNQIFTFEQGRRLYPIFGLVSQFGLILAGLVSMQIGKVQILWQKSLSYLSLSVLIAGALLSVSFVYLVKMNNLKELINKTRQGRDENKMSVFESIKYVFKSKYLILLTVLVLCYGVSISITETVWKKSIGSTYPLHGDYLSFMGEIQLYLGIATIISMLFGSYFIKKMSWKSSAYVTPMITLATGAVFLFLLSLKEAFQMNELLPQFSFVFLYLGAGQYVLSKSSKYSFFDVTKELSYIPLDQSLKSRGKASVELVGGSFGKSLGSLIQLILLSTFVGSDLFSLSPYLFCFLILIGLIWIVSLNRLSRKLEGLIEMK